MKHTAVFGLLLCLSSATIASSQALKADRPFSFRGNALGMNYEEFKRTNSDATWKFPTVVSEKKKAKTFRWNEVHGPFCSDQYADQFSEAASNEIVCDTHWPEDHSRDDLTISGIKVKSIRYRFLSERLNSIEIYFDPTAYEFLKTAFIKKYGTPTSIKTEVAQNGGGAQWNTENSQWSKGDQSIDLEQGKNPWKTDAVGVALISYKKGSSFKAKVDF